MNAPLDQLLAEHRRLTRRFFLRSGSAGLMALGSLPLFGEEFQQAPELQKAIAGLESYLTSLPEFRDVSRGSPKPHSLPLAKRKEVGLTRDTWKLEVIGDSESPPRLGKELTAKENTAFGFQDLMKLAETRAVRFAKVMTCLNIGCPLGMGIWEGVPLRDVIWLTQPRSDLRRVFYYGYHNDDPKQRFQSSLPVGRILEDPYDLPPVILCYKLNGQWLSPERGAPVRIVMPEGYGFKCIKWLSHMVLSNRFNANDTYGTQNNDVDSPLKTFCATLSIPPVVKPNEQIPVTGWGQVGISGLKKVQFWVHNNADPLPEGDRYFSKAPWRDATILPPPKNWGGGLPDNKIPAST
ncbi:MAG: molybdopterin-dependent oxidoreductase, partial [Planctomycetota bacterium]|nr:molybdopterin-dependent oxidoreductase [Planctomycetota bacterium]